MKIITSHEIEKLVLRLYRKLCSSPNDFKLNEKDKQTILSIVKLFNFTIADEHRGIVGYSDWAIPVIVNQEPDIRIVDQGEGLTGNQSEIFRTVKYQIYSDFLLAVWDGHVTDVMLVYAGLIQIGHQVEVLPRLSDKKCYSYEMAKKEYDKRLRGKHDKKKP